MRGVMEQQAKDINTIMTILKETTNRQPPMPVLHHDEVENELENIERVIEDTRPNLFLTGGYMEGLLGNGTNGTINNSKSEVSTEETEAIAKSAIEMMKSKFSPQELKYGNIKGTSRMKKLNEATTRNIYCSIREKFNLRPDFVFLGPIETRIGIKLNAHRKNIKLLTPEIPSQS
eukprot:TCONS_00037427-protein